MTLGWFLSYFFYFLPSEISIIWYPFIQKLLNAHPWQIVLHLLLTWTCHHSEIVAYCPALTHPTLTTVHPGGSGSKESSCNAGDPGSTPRLGRSPGEGKGNPLQYSRLENSMDRGAWRAMVHGVAKSWTWLSDFSLSTHTLFTMISTVTLFSKTAKSSSTFQSSLQINKWQLDAFCITTY